MNVDTYNAIAILDEVVAFPSKGPRLRVFSTNTGSLFAWFELSPGEFWCGETKADAEETRSEVPRSPARLDKLKDLYSKGSVRFQ